MGRQSEHPKKSPRLWRLLRIYFRRFRIVAWLFLLLVLGFLIYLNQVGLPGFLKEPLLDRLHARGIDFDYSRLRLRWYEGLVAENVQFGSAVGEFSPSLSAREAKVSVHWRSLLQGRAQVDALTIRGGTFRMPIIDPDRPARELVVSNIQTELRLLPGDQWILDEFNASFADAGLRLTATVDNASAARDWSLFKGERNRAGQERTQERMRSVMDIIERIHFRQKPELTVKIRGDARDVRSFTAQISADAPEASTPWGSFSQGGLQVRIHPSRTTSDFVASVQLDARNGDTRWGSVEQFKLAVDLVQPDTITNLVQGKLQLSAARARSKWASGTEVLADIRWLHALTNPVPLWATGQVSCAQTETRWAKAQKTVLRASLTSTNSLQAGDSPDWAWWTNLAPFSIRFDCHALDVLSPDLEVTRADLSGAWSAPRLELTSLQADLYEGSLSGKAELDVQTRRAAADASLNFDIHKVGGIMTEGGRRWIGQYFWNSPPAVSASGSVTLPAWTNRQPDWRAEVLPTLWLSGQFSATNGAGYKGLKAQAASSDFSYSNMTWRLPNLVVQRPEGRLEASHIAHDRTRDYYWKIHSTIDPMIIRSLLQTNETRAFDLLQLDGPPEIHAEVWGRFHQHDLLGARAHVLATNLSFRGQTASRIEGTVFYTNNVIRVIEPKVERGEEKATAEAVVVDFNAQQVYLTNASGALDPMAVARAIGPKVGKTMEDYIFDRPPRARAYGVIPMHGEEGSDLHFDVDGGPFHWWKFNIPRISGHIHWKDYQLALSNLRADFYSGSATGNAVFDLSDIPGTEFMFSMTGTNVLLQSLLADLATSTNKSEGWLDGTVVVTRANSSDWRSVQGYGDLYFHDGLLWDLPLFGVLSPVLDGIKPGLGSSRATEGACYYILTNGVFRTADLDIRTTTMRLEYRGDVDLAQDYQINARVEAELLRDMWVVGPLVSTLFWPVTKLFEYKVEGTLGDPKLEPVNVIPKLMLIPFHPLRMLKGSPKPPQSHPPLE